MEIHIPHLGSTFQFVNGKNISIKNFGNEIFCKCVMGHTPNKMNLSTSERFENHGPCPTHTIKKCERHVKKYGFQTNPHYLINGSLNCAFCDYENDEIPDSNVMKKFFEYPVIGSGLLAIKSHKNKSESGTKEELVLYYKDLPVLDMFKLPEFKISSPVPKKIKVEEQPESNPGLEDKPKHEFTIKTDELSRILGFESMPKKQIPNIPDPPQQQDVFPDLPFDLIPLPPDQQQQPEPVVKEITIEDVTEYIEKLFKNEKYNSIVDYIINAYSSNMNAVQKRLEELKLAQGGQAFVAFLPLSQGNKYYKKILYRVEITKRKLGDEQKSYRILMHEAESQKISQIKGYSPFLYSSKLFLGEKKISVMLMDFVEGFTLPRIFQLLQENHSRFNRNIDVSTYTRTKFKDAISLINYYIYQLHKIKVYHGDLNPANFIFYNVEKNSDKLNVAIIDFTGARYIIDPEKSDFYPEYRTKTGQNLERKGYGIRQSFLMTMDWISLLYYIPNMFNYHNEPNPKNPKYYESDYEGIMLLLFFSNIQNIYSNTPGPYRSVPLIYFQDYVDSKYYEALNRKTFDDEKERKYNEYIKFLMHGIGKNDLTTAELKMNAKFIHRIMFDTKITPIPQGIKWRFDYPKNREWILDGYNFIFN